MKAIICTAILDPDALSVSHMSDGVQHIIINKDLSEDDIRKVLEEYMNTDCPLCGRPAETSFGHSLCMDMETAWSDHSIGGIR